MMKRLLPIMLICWTIPAEAQRAFNRFITDTIFRSAHLGAAVFDPAADTYLYSYQSDKYFVPASNTKIVTCYAALKLLPDTLEVAAADTWWQEMGPGWAWTDDEEVINYFPYAGLVDSGVVWGGPIDSLLRPMMHRSDNFLAEQLYRKMQQKQLSLDSLTKTVMGAGRQLPKWVDGCGLSRYNLFTPQQMVAVLNRMYKEVEWARLKTIFPTGGAGTLKHLYLTERNQVFAKTGSLTGVIGLSGYVITKSNRVLIFSVLINNYEGSGFSARKRIERFIRELRNEP